MRKHVYKYKYKYEYSRSIQNKSREGGLHFYHVPVRRYQGHLYVTHIGKNGRDRRDLGARRVGARVGTERALPHV